MSCDSIEKIGEQFSIICCVLRSGMKKSLLRDELQYMEEYSRKLKPKISAAGFYMVNQLILVGVFSAAATYSILCIEFNAWT